MMNKPLKSHVPPDAVLSVIGRNMLADGLEMVVDLEKSQGAYIYDSWHGRRYVDFFSYFASAPVGMNHPKMKEKAFLEKMQRTALHKISNSDCYTVEMAEFVDTFSKFALPSYLKYLFFVEGGALAVENALKVAFDWKVRKNFKKGHVAERGHQVIHFRECFHGRSGYTMSLTNTDPAKTDLYPKFHWPRILNPKLQFPITEAELARVQAEEVLAISQIKQAIADHPDDIAALIIEPIQAEGGDNHFRPEFLHELRKITLENDILLIFDEIQTGMGITGKLWAHEHFGVQPDIMSFGKKTQVCGIAVSTRIDDVPENVFHLGSRINSTWGGNLIDMVRATRYMEIMAEDGLVENAASMGNNLMNGINDLITAFPSVLSNPRGRGLFCAITVSSRDIRNRIIGQALDDGLIILPCGLQSIRFRPALDITHEAIEEGMSILRQSIQKVVTI